MLRSLHMITSNIADIRASLNSMVGKAVITKFKNGRSISGTLSEKDGVFTVKLGIQHLVVDPELLAKPVIAL